MKVRNVVSFTAFGLMIVLSVGYIASLGVRIKPPSNRTDLSMTIADINGLVVDSNVLLRGVPVGKVTKIAGALDGATVDFYIDGRFHVPVDCDVRIDNLSSLGETYIGLVPRSEGGPVFRDGQHVATQRIIQPPSITELAVSVTRVLNQLDPSAVERILRESDTALPNPDSVLPNLSHAGKLLRNTAVDMHGHGRVLLSNFQTLLRNAGWLGPAIAGGTPGLQYLYVGFKRDLDGVGTMIWGVDGNNLVMLTALNTLLNRIQRLLDSNGGDLKVLGEALQPKVKGIAGALLTFDPSQILSNIVDALPEDGAITLHVTIPPN
ncbi:MlaD family protein [Mycobacterium arosiense]|uniref:Mammalian cell entry protein n=1 Tax=Mycobacterium arosiense ATCC BAA-1401 = DSM 45069 TaxID=1265311 RepID=A0A1W9Z7R1_MYCAI|nr:MlaD family protein [Mycobacterium arosiense]ORA08799.1 mammalian cell entry protein [Mycobacterium arosiense ATCC BAA-1401 = DSM 45069]